MLNPSFADKSLPTCAGRGTFDLFKVAIECIEHKIYLAILPNLPGTIYRVVGTLNLVRNGQVLAALPATFTNDSELGRYSNAFPQTPNATGIGQNCILLAQFDDSDLFLYPHAVKAQFDAVQLQVDEYQCYVEATAQPGADTITIPAAVASASLAWYQVGKLKLLRSGNVPGGVTAETEYWYWGNGSGTVLQLYAAYEDVGVTPINLTGANISDVRVVLISAYGIGNLAITGFKAYAVLQSTSKPTTAE